MIAPTMGELYRFLLSDVQPGHADALPSERRREIARWMFCCLDEDFPALLSHIIDKIQEGMTLEEFEQYVEEERSKKIKRRVWRWRHRKAWRWRRK